VRDPRGRRAASLAGAVIVLFAAGCAPPSPVQPSGAEPDVRIGLAVNVPSADVSGEGVVAGVVDGRVAFRIAGGAAVHVTPVGRGIHLTGAAKGEYERVTFTSVDGRRVVTLAGKPYRGVLEVFAASGGVSVVNQLPVDQYLAGVVNAEMGRRAPSERAALEAQAIVARTYALKNRGKRGSDGFDLTATAADQVYGGVGAETDLGLEAVHRTAGEVLTYGGQLITVFFHSTCGYSTASPEEVLRYGERLPYLRPVSDKSPTGYYCDISPRFRWSVEWDAATLIRILRRTIPAVLGVDSTAIDDLRDVRVQRTGPSGRVMEMRVVVGHGEIPVFGPDLRRVLETPDGNMLGSTAIQLDVTKQDGRLQRVLADGAGWGHGLGLCQWGAVGRARAGQDARTIVTTYFPGAVVARWYR
jgi:stage II sporulation protein D